MPCVTLPVSPRLKWVFVVLVGSAFVTWAMWEEVGWRARGVILGGFGIVLPLVVLPLALRARKRLKSGVPTQGTVVGAEQRESGGMDTPTVYHHPKVRFTTPEGRTVVFTSAFGSDSEPEMGYPVRVRYRADNPEQAEIETRWVWMLPAALGSLGGLGLLVAGVLVYLQE